jgi:hypothetical protein
VGPRPQLTQEQHREQLRLESLKLFIEDVHRNYIYEQYNELGVINMLFLEDENLELVFLKSLRIIKDRRVRKRIRDILYGLGSQ